MNAGQIFFITSLDFHQEMERAALKRISPLGETEFLLAGELAIYQRSLESLKQALRLTHSLVMRS